MGWTASVGPKDLKAARKLVTRREIMYRKLTQRDWNDTTIDTTSRGIIRFVRIVF